jgi:hypothetical protein
MPISKRNATAAALAATIVLSLAAPLASAAEGSSHRSQFGVPAEDRAAQREILIGPDTRWANVTEGETIRFVVRTPSGAGESFTWYFDTVGDRSMDLRQIAPPGTIGRPLHVYIGYDPRTHGQ